MIILIDLKTEQIKSVKNGNLARIMVQSGTHMYSYDFDNMKKEKEKEIIETPVKKTRKKRTKTGE